MERSGLTAACYLLASLVFTWPLPWRFTTYLPAGSGDLWQNYWNLWWWKKALLEFGQSPYYTDHLFHPHGASLVFQTHSPFNMLVSLPVNVLFGEAAAYNFCVILALWLSGWGAYLFVRELTGEGSGAFLAGLVFAFFPQHMDQSFEHLNLVSVQFIPLSLWFFLRLRRTGDWSDAVGLGLSLGLNAICSWHLGLMLGLVVVPWAGLELWRVRGERALSIRLAVSALTAAVIAAPWLAPMFTEMALGATYYQKAPVDRGIDAAYLLVPQWEHPIWGGLTVEAYQDRAYVGAGFVCYLGFVPLCLGVLAVTRRGKTALPWALLALGTLVLSLGAQPFWNGKLIESLTLPFAVLEHIPLLSTLRVANRFLILTSLGLGVLAALGWQALGVKSSVGSAAAVGLILLDYAWLPYPVRSVAANDSGAYQLIRESADGAVLDIPFHQKNRTVHNMLAQTFHERPMGGGYLSAFPPEIAAALNKDTVLSELAGVPAPSGPMDVDHLRSLGFRWIVLHKYRRESYREKLLENTDRSDIFGFKAAKRLGGIPDETMDRIRVDLTRQVGSLSFEDDRIAVFDIGG